MAGGEEMRNWGLKGRVIQSYKMKTVMGMDGGDGCTTGTYLMPLTCALQNVYDGKFCHMYFNSSFKKVQGCGRAALSDGEERPAHHASPHRQARLTFPASASPT